MKKAITIICLIGALLLILDSVHASHWLVLFFLAGVIPGTNILISATDTLAANATAITIVILRITVWPTIRTFFFPQATTADTTKKHTPHRVI
jgi:hypothetical protein